MSRSQNKSKHTNGDAEHLGVFDLNAFNDTIGNLA